MILNLFLPIFLFATEQNDFCIMECFRTMFSSRSVQEASAKQKIDPPFHPVHCYAVFTKGNQIIASRGFYDTGAQEEPEDKIELSKCIIIKKYENRDQAAQEWASFVDSFNLPVKYSATQMNCCTRIVESFRNIGFDTPLGSESVNFGIGTTRKISPEAFKGEENSD